MVSSEQRLECPICQQTMTLRGLHGHLRIKHQKQKEEIMELIEQAPMDQLGDAEEVLNLLDMLKYLKERDAWIGILKARGCFQREEAEIQLREFIQGEARPIFTRLSDLGIILDEADVSAYCSGGSEEE